MNLVEKIFKQFVKEYNFLYDNYDNVAGYDEALEYGDEVISTMPELVDALCKLRCDYFSSDREVAALGFAVNEILG